MANRTRERRPSSRDNRGKNSGDKPSGGTRVGAGLVTERRERRQFFLGFLSSLFGHIIFALIAFLSLQYSSARAIKPNEVFSVTLEGGVNLGGVTQVPKEGAKKILTTPDDTPDEAPPGPEATSTKVTEPEPQPEKNLKTPSVVEDPEKILAAKKLEADKLQKMKEKDQAEKKKREAEEKKKKLEADEQSKKKKEEEAKKLEKAQRDKKLEQSLRRLQKRYEGESADAGGKGFGAAALGGKGMGGGTLTSLARLSYAEALKKHVKQGWHWLGSSDQLTAEVRVRILADGQIQDVRIEQSSGNRNFDDSVVRAVYKASPVPAPPSEFYADFSDVRFTFDSRE